MGALSAKIEDIAEDITSQEADLKKATAVRKKEQEDFAIEEKELMETINTIERAVTIIEREMSGASLVQVKAANSITQALEVMVQASVFSTADASRLTALVQSSEEDSDDSEDVGAPDPTVYENQSGGVVDTLTALLSKAKDQLDEARKKETQSIHAFELLQQSLTDGIKFANKDLVKSKKGLAGASEAKSAAEGELEMTAKDLASNIKSLSELHHECMETATDFEAATTSRGEELKALATAKKVLNDTTGGAVSLTYSLSQEAASFLQVAARTESTSYQAVRLIRDLAKKHHSTALALLASRVASAMQSSSSEGANPFAKVEKLISAMIVKLEAEAEADATKKAYCDKEMSETEATKAEKSAEVDKLSTKIDAATSKSAMLKQQVAEVQKELAELAATQAAMDKLRSEEHEQYLTDKPELEQGLEGVKLAIKVLKEYYGKDDKSHEEAAGAAAGIIGLLQVCESDFSKGLAETIAEEESAQATYEEDTKSNEVDKASKDQDVKYKTKEAASLDAAVAEMTSDLKGVQDELAASVEYLNKLEEACVAKPETYEERKAAREAELAGLKEALEILSSDDSFIQRSTTHRKLRGVVHHRPIA